MSENDIKLISVAEAARRLGVTRGRVAQLINAGRLPATKVGRSYVIKQVDLKLVQDRTPGRPPGKMDKK